jgi:hypothetical protein
MNETDQNIRNYSCGVCNADHDESRCQLAISSANIIFERALNIRVTEVRETQSFDSLKTYFNSLTNTQLRILCGKLKLEKYIDYLIERDILDDYDTMFMTNKLLVVSALLWFYMFDTSTANTIAFYANIDDMFYRDNIPFPQDAEFSYPEFWEPFPKKIDLRLLFSNKTEVFDCPICLETKDIQNKCLLNCSHSLCDFCLINYLSHENNKGSPSCSLCRANITTISFTNQEIFDKFKIERGKI